MTNSKIAAALATQLDTLDLPTHWENSNFTPVAGQIYVSESLLQGATIPIGIATGSSDELGGIYQVLVYAPMDAGKGAGRTVADTVAGAFQRGARLVYDDYTVTIQSVSQAAAFISGDRWVIPVSIAYRAFS
jgi:hypothetical protein